MKGEMFEEDVSVPQLPVIVGSPIGPGLGSPENYENESYLIRSAKAGNEAALSEIFKRYNQKIFAISFRYLRNVEDASDVVQETFINAFKYMSDFQQRAELSTWLTKICLNICWHRKKSRKPEVSLDAEFETEEDSLKMQFADNRPLPCEEIEKKEEALTVRRAVDSLEKKYREIIVLRELEGYSYEKITRELNISRGTVMSRLHRARKVLNRKLNRYALS